MLVLLVLAGCASDPEVVSAPAPDVPAPVSAPPDTADVPSGEAALALDPDGFRVVSASGSTSPLAFGIPFEDAVAALSRLRGEPASRAVSPECGAGPLDTASWDDGLTVYGQDDEFAGWALSGRSGPSTWTTMAGAGIGSTRVDLDSAYDLDVQETTLGTEFSAGGLHGILSGPETDATVTHLWAGVPCTFR
ncbi:hypothetical protein [Rubrivirga sp.]|uniref:hypothetical protein n=1 Tax=Rubrivirga sp. TaxID=1885344 RepID=UPI003B51981E